MAQVLPETDRLEVPVGQTVGGGDLVIVPTQTGLYRIEHRGPGAAPRVTEQLFTSLYLAKRAVDAYRRTNAAVIAKKALLDKVVEAPSLKEQRKQEALALKNGELEVPDTDEE
jgi:hypothetical protein